MNPCEMERRVLRLERNYNWFAVLMAVIALGAMCLCLTAVRSIQASSNPDVLRVRETDRHQTKTESNA